VANSSHPNVIKSSINTTWTVVLSFPLKKGIKSIFLGLPNEQVKKFAGLAKSGGVKTQLLNIGLLVFINAIRIGQ
jgi:hypothetical protein